MTFLHTTTTFPSILSVLFLYTTSHPEWCMVLKMGGALQNHPTDESLFIHLSSPPFADDLLYLPYRCWYRDGASVPPQYCTASVRWMAYSPEIWNFSHPN